MSPHVWRRSIANICSLARNFETVLVTKDKSLIANTDIVICVLIPMFVLFLFVYFYFFVFFSAVVAHLPAVEVAASLYL